MRDFSEYTSVLTIIRFVFAEVTDPVRKRSVGVIWPERSLSLSPGIVSSQ